MEKYPPCNEFTDNSVIDMKSYLERRVAEARSINASRRLDLYPVPGDIREAAEYLTAFAENLEAHRPHADIGSRVQYRHLIYAQHYMHDNMPEPPTGTLREQILQAEIHATRDLFQPLDPSHKLRFYCPDARTWLWQRQWTEAVGEEKTLELRYRSNGYGITKQINGCPQSLDLEEAQLITRMAALYEKKALNDVYRTQLSIYTPEDIDG